MEEFPINFNIYGVYGTSERWCEAQFTETDCAETKTTITFQLDYFFSTEANVYMNKFLIILVNNCLFFSQNKE